MEDLEDFIEGLISAEIDRIMANKELQGHIISTLKEMLRGIMVRQLFEGMVEMQGDKIKDMAAIYVKKREALRNLEIRLKAAESLTEEAEEQLKRLGLSAEVIGRLKEGNKVASSANSTNSTV